MKRLPAKLMFPAFMAIAVLPSAAMLVGLAVVARHSDVADWSALGAGASVGGLSALIVLYGWRLTGPVEVARADVIERRRLYSQSVADRALLFLALLPPGILVGCLLVPSEARWTAAAMVVATSLNGVSALWFAVGVGDPWLCLRFETLPRLVATLLGTGVVAVGAPVWAFPLGLAAGAAWGGWVTTRQILAGDLGMVQSSVPAVPDSLRGRGRAAATEITAGGYSVASVAIVGAVASSDVTASFVSADRLFRAALIPVSAMSSSLQRGVSEAGQAAFPHKALRAVILHLTLGLAGLALLVTCGRALTALLFSDEFDAPQSAMVAYGIAFLAISLNTTLGRHFLASQGRTGALLFGTCAGVVVGVVALVAGAMQEGVTGAAVGVALGECSVLLAFLVSALRRPSVRGARTPSL